MPKKGCPFAGGLGNGCHPALGGGSVVFAFKLVVEMFYNVFGVVFEEYASLENEGVPGAILVGLP